jgi:hypothetical protein
MTWRKLHHAELHNLCPSPNNIGVIKSRRMIWVCSTHGREGKTEF